jgi:hypothetical protein
LLTTKLKLCVSLFPALSVSLTAKLKVPSALVLPAIVPVVLSKAIPDGSEPDARAQW